MRILEVFQWKSDCSRGQRIHRLLRRQRTGHRTPRSTSPPAIALDSKGYLYICDTNNSLIRKISPEGIITTIAGTTVAECYCGLLRRRRFRHRCAAVFSARALSWISPEMCIFPIPQQQCIRELTASNAGHRQWRGGATPPALPPKFSPGALATVFGANFTGTGLDASAPSLPLPSSLGGVSVLVNGVAAPVLYESSEQINFQIPVGNQDRERPPWW